MFENLSTRLKKTLRDLRNQGHVSVRHIEESMREIRLALLEADVHFKVVKEFISQVQEKATGQEVLRSLTPGQQIIKIVRDELIGLLGGETNGLSFSKIPPSVFLIVGLQGSGKTTTTGKLAQWLAQNGRRALMVSTDVYRPAAIEQLSVVGNEISIPVFHDSQLTDPIDLSKKALQQTRNRGFDVLLIDTAGRLHIDEKLMVELEQIQTVAQPIETLLVADAMTGQDAVNSARDFDRRLGLSGVILTKMDGDARGGAALSIKSVIDLPIKFVGTGEKYDALEMFHPDRMANRILGMGDVVSLIEKAEEVADQEVATQALKKLSRDQFTLEDFLQQIRQIRKLGSMDQILEMLPRTGPFKSFDKVNVDDQQLVHIEAIINSMTKKERVKYKIINGSRRKRIARGSGRPVSEVNRLLKQYVQMKKMMKKVNKGFLGKGLSKLRFPF